MATDYKLKKTDIEDIQQLIKTLRDSWTSTYLKFSDYRRMANGELPKEMADRLELPEYERRSKLRPRIIVDAIKDMKSYINHTIFNNPDGPFEFTPVDDQTDWRNAENSTRLVRHGWKLTGVKMTAKSVLDDTLQTGVGYSMISQSVKRRFVGNNFREVYRGAESKRLRVESVFPQKVKYWESVSALARLFVLPVSYLLKETVPGGLLIDHKKAVKNLKRVHFDDPELLYELYPESTENAEQAENQIKDFPVLIAELWQSAMYGKDEIPQWYRTWVADFEAGDPIVIGFDEDPMGTNYHNIIRSQVFPVTDRLTGAAVPEMLVDLDLEMFNKVNQMIDYGNLLSNLQGTVIGRHNGMAADSLICRIGRFMGLKTGEPKDLHTIGLDVQPLITGYQELGRIQHDVEHTMAQNANTFGREGARRETATVGSIINEGAIIRQTDPVEEFEETYVKPTANAYLMQAQIFMGQTQRLRILGQDGAIEWEGVVTPEDIMGAYDVVCTGSAQIIPRAMKQANIKAIMDSFMANPYLAPKIDWISFFKDIMELIEFPKAKRYIKDQTQVEADIKRENDFMVASGMAWPVNLTDDDTEHLKGHVGVIDRLDNGQMHIAEHLNNLQMKQGKSTGSQQAMYTQSGEMLNDVSATGSPKALGR